MEILFTIFALWGFFTKGADMEQDVFQIEYYGGLRQNAVVKVHYTERIPGWLRQPQYCYGALIDFTVAIVPCSCVAFIDDKKMASPWNQASHLGFMIPVMNDALMVGLMGDEHSDKEKTNQVAVNSIVIHKKCDPTFQVDFALLNLTGTLKEARLTWVNSPDVNELKKQFNAVSSASVVHGRCTVLRWIETIARPNEKKTWSIKESTVYFQMWNMCVRLVCPLKTPQGKEYIPAHSEQCFNENVGGHRFCLTMIPEEVPLCNFVPGSPVFCEVGGFHGIVGILTNFTTNCKLPEYRNALMASFEDAMDLARPYLRVRASSYYSKLRVLIQNDETTVHP